MATFENPVAENIDEPTSVGERKLAVPSWLYTTCCWFMDAFCGSPRRFQVCQALLYIQFICGYYVILNVPKYRDNSEHPQHAFLSAIRTYYLLYYFIFDGGTIWAHRVLRKLQTSGTMKEIVRTARPSVGVTFANVVAKVSGTYLVFMMVFYFLTFFFGSWLGFFLPMTLTTLGDSDPATHPFSSNWTVNFEVDDCWGHPARDVAQSKFNNITEAEIACEQLGQEVCAGVGSRYCNDHGPYQLCDARWIPVHFSGNTMCAASPPGSAWATHTTDPYTVPTSSIWIAAAISGPLLVLKIWIASVLAMSYVVVTVAVMAHVEDARDQLMQMKNTSARVADSAMTTLVRLETDIIMKVNSEWGPAMSWYSAIMFGMAVYYAVTISLGIDGGLTGYILLSAGISGAINVHIALIPAALSTEISVQLMGAINGLRYIQSEDSDGAVTMVDQKTIIEAECLSTFVRETNDGGGMGVYLPIMGKVTTEKIVQIGSTIVSILLILAQILAPSETYWELDMERLKSTLAEQGQTIDRLVEQITSLQSTCQIGSGR